jgi:membrane-associated phospholipid phosphatase
MTETDLVARPQLRRPQPTRGTEKKRTTVPALEARPGGAAERFARALGLRHPVATFFAALAGGFVLLAGLSILLGVLVTHVLITSAGLGTPDNDFVRTLAEHRSSTLTPMSEVGSQVGGAPVLPIAAFAVFVLAAESATYRVTTLVVHRQRPDVPRLEQLPVDASYPSGHTAASVAVYSGLVLLLTSRFTNSTGRALAWTAAILATTFVAMSRMYRGMHHPLDVAGGVIVGIGAILVLLFACRAARVAADARGRS